MTTQLLTKGRWFLRLVIIGCLVITNLLLPLRVAPIRAQASGEVIFAVTSANRLLRFASTTPDILTSAQPITGLQPSERVLGIDFRPADGRLYALGSSNRLYTVNPQTGSATVVAGQPFTATVSGENIGFDFNPMPDRLRVVTEAGDNLRLHPATGAIAGIDTTLVYTDTDVNADSFPEIGAAAYSNNISGSATTTLYVIDASLDILARQGGLDGAPSPNTGLLFTIGELAVDVTAMAGFDISPAGNAYAALTNAEDDTASFYTIDLTSGEASLVDAIGGLASNETVVGLAVPTGTVPPPIHPVFAVTAANRLVQFSSATPGVLTASQLISGLPANENILGIDFRPADGRLYALSNGNRLYTLDPWTAAATLISSQPLTQTLNGFAFGFDFNPVPDRIRVVSDAEQNLRLHPITGGVAGIDASLAYSTTDTNAAANPTIVAAAYTNNISGTTTTTLYGIDTDLDILVRQGGLNGPPSPNTGLLFTVGALGVNLANLVGFDIAPSGAAFVAGAGADATTSNFYYTDLASGQLTLVGAIAAPEQVVGMAIPTGSLPPPAEPIFALTNANRLIRFNSATPSLLTASQPISGLPTGETLLGLDFRPATGQLYALGSGNRLYTLDPVSGAATVVGSQPLTQTLSGAAFGFDFNPMPDRIRVVSDAEQNLRLHPVTGAVAGIDASLAYTTTDPNAAANPTIVAAAYTNNISGSMMTTLYGIDATLDLLVRQGGLNGSPSPNTGLLATVGALGVDATALTGFDIAPSGVAYAAFTPGSGASNFYQIDLTTGQARLLGTIGSTESVIGVAAPTGITLPPAQPVFAVTSANRLIQFSSATPATLTATQPISGLQTGETVLGIDFRPADGKLYALGSTNRLYTIDRTTAAATVLSTQPLTQTLTGAAFGFDFNPVPDRIRVVSDAEQNLRLHPVTGNVAGIDSTLVYSTTDLNAGTNPMVVAVAYTNNISGSKSTTLYVIDANRDTLALQGGPNGAPSPNGGQLFTVGRLGVDVGNLAGFDIAPTGAAFAAGAALGATTTNFFVVNLASGKLTLVGPIGGGETVVGLALPTITPTQPTARQTYLPLVAKQP